MKVLKMTVFLAAAILVLGMQDASALMLNRGRMMNAVSFGQHQGAGNALNSTRHAGGGLAGNFTQLPRRGSIFGNGPGGNFSGHIQNWTATAGVDTVCVVNALNKREDAIFAGAEQYASGMKSALGARKTALNAAWSVQDRGRRRIDIRTAWNAFKGSWKSAASSLQTARKNAWAQYKTDMKACKTTPDDAEFEAFDQGLAK